MFGFDCGDWGWRTGLGFSLWCRFNLFSINFYAVLMKKSSKRFVIEKEFVRRNDQRNLPGSIDAGSGRVTGNEAVLFRNSSCSSVASRPECGSPGELLTESWSLLRPSIVQQDLCSLRHPDPWIAKEFQLKIFLKLLCIPVIHRLSSFSGCRKPPLGSPPNIVSRTQNKHSWWSTV